MDAAFFRFLGPELAGLLQGVRFDTVYGPAPGFWTLAFTPPVLPGPDPSPACRFLLLRVHTRLGLLFPCDAKPPNPATPDARVMWLRKRLKGRKVLGGQGDWPRRRLALELSPGEGRFLLLSMEDDPVVLERLPEGFGEAPRWDGPDRALADPACPRSLRRALLREEALDRAELLEDFLAGRARGFHLAEESPSSEGPLPWPASRQSLRLPTALAAAVAHGRPVFFAALAPADDEPTRLEQRKKKRLEHLERDRKRLDSLTGRQAFGEAVAANLSRLDPRARTGPLTLEHPALGPLEVPMDPGLTVIENMEAFFRKAAKGRRGLAHVERMEGETLRGELPPQRPRAQGPARPASATIPPKDPDLHRFRSSDGFLILRGRNAKANHRLLTSLASPFDYWLHAEGGPGAHVILKRDSPHQEPPEATLREAAALAARASWRSGEAHAAVLLARVADVRAIKGAAAGRVRVDVARTLFVDPSACREETLAEGA
ncbi:hypothetical protein NNJEOMEG_02960 [Fundidesulfovibrio magnetotacticus]|uniref:NFACT RNA-binding domain-containing protein n=1 Tax=Fundidesulfovibrio magnetotacticus TaxID=2730080 RepID=A0A6V8LRJ6_9BACT|nr:NFACT RNA binding domain-containing protein [Fundidesulfovibrio magnetotacticus]GFK95103.1 hypothetical protein NNJEOMEG_02960 [Fundidesulfovibrio magnetotacticus]